jgi:hypothetical protein
VHGHFELERTEKYIKNFFTEQYSFLTWINQKWEVRENYKAKITKKYCRAVKEKKWNRAIKNNNNKSIGN